MLMRRLAGYGFRLALVWCIWWALVAVGVPVLLPYGTGPLRAAGWTAEIDVAGIAGFPGRFDFSLARLDLADPRSGVAWRGEAIALSAPAWNPLHVTLATSARQTLVTAAGRFDLRAGAAQLTAALEPGFALTFTGLKMELSEATLASNRGWRMALGRGRLSLWQARSGQNTYDLTADIADFTPALWQRRTIDPTGRLPIALEQFTLDASIAFDAPWDRSVLDGAQPQPSAIELRGFRLRWGDVSLEASGSVTIDAEGRPTGSGRIGTANWPALLAQAEAAGLIDALAAAELRQTLTALAAAGDPLAFSAPVYFADGLMAIGPVPVGPAPVIRLR